MRGCHLLATVLYNILCFRAENSLGLDASVSTGGLARRGYAEISMPYIMKSVRTLSKMVSRRLLSH